MRRLGTTAAKDELNSSTFVVVVVVMMIVLWTSEQAEEAVNTMLLSQPGNWVARVARRLHAHACLLACMHIAAAHRRRPCSSSLKLPVASSRSNKPHCRRRARAVCQLPTSCLLCCPSDLLLVIVGRSSSTTIDGDDHHKKEGPRPRDPVDPFRRA